MFLRAGNGLLNVAQVWRALWLEDERALAIWGGAQNELVTLRGDDARTAWEVLNACRVQVAVAGYDPGATDRSDV